MSSPNNPATSLPRMPKHARQGSRSTSNTQSGPNISSPPEASKEGNDDSSSTSAEEDAPTTDLPLSMTSSVLLSQLPKDTTAALATLDAIEAHKCAVRFQAIGSAPILKQKVFTIKASSKFGAVVSFLRKKLGIKEGDGLFCYINSVFAPGLDEGVGGLHRVSLLFDLFLSVVTAFGENGPTVNATTRAVGRGSLRHSLQCVEKKRAFRENNSTRLLTPSQCFKTDDQLIVAYSITPAFG